MFAHILFFLLVLCFWLLRSIFLNTIQTLD